MPACSLRRISDHAVWFTPDERTDRPSLVAVSGETATALLDVGASPAHTGAFLEALRPLGLPPLRCAVLTHWHWDHAFGAAALDVPVIAHRLTAAGLAVQRGYGWSDAELDARVEAGLELAFCRDMLRLEIPDRSRLEVPLPQIVFDDRLELDLGGVHVELVHVGGDHAADSVAMRVAEDDLLVLGDAWYERLYAPEPELTIEGVRGLVARLRALGGARAIEGHGDELLDAAAISTRLDGLEAAAHAVAARGGDALDGLDDPDARELVALLLVGEARAATVAGSD